jgi:hypothetical protein
MKWAGFCVHIWRIKPAMRVTDGPETSAREKAEVAFL